MTLCCCYALFSFFFAASFAEKWVEVGSQLECDGYAGEVYMDSSRGKVQTLDACKKSCEDTASCKSITYFKTKWCTHWSTPCTKTRWKRKVAISLTLDIADKIDEEKNEDNWSEIGAELICDHEAGEKYLDSSRGKVQTLEACKQSCDDAKLCKSVSYFKTKWCSHWSTPCTKTQVHKKVAMSLSLDITDEIDLGDIAVLGSGSRGSKSKGSAMSVCTQDNQCKSEKCLWKRCTQKNQKHDADGPCGKDVDCNTGYCSYTKFSPEIKNANSIQVTATTCKPKDFEPLRACANDNECKSGKCVWKRCAYSNGKHDAPGPCSEDDHCNSGVCSDTKYRPEIKGVPKRRGDFPTAKACKALLEKGEVCSDIFGRQNHHLCKSKKCNHCSKPGSRKCTEYQCASADKPADGASAPPPSKYNSCEGKKDKEQCFVCDPNKPRDKTCVETSDIKTCQRGMCIPLKIKAQPSKYNSCEGKKDKEQCFVCDPNKPRDKTCVETSAIKTCQKGKCIALKIKG